MKKILNMNKKTMWDKNETETYQSKDKKNYLKVTV